MSLTDGQLMRWVNGQPARHYSIRDDEVDSYLRDCVYRVHYTEAYSFDSITELETKIRDSLIQSYGDSNMYRICAIEAFRNMPQFDDDESVKNNSDEKIHIPDFVYAF